jgi:hypothetical protein
MAVSAETCCCLTLLRLGRIYIYIKFMNQKSNVTTGNCVLFELRARNVVTIILATQADNPSGTSVTTYKSTRCHSS